MKKHDSKQPTAVEGSQELPSLRVEMIETEESFVRRSYELAVSGRTTGEAQVSMMFLVQQVLPLLQSSKGRT